MSLAVLLEPVIEQLRARQLAAGTRPRVVTGFADLDSLTGGPQPGEVWAVTGASGVGKSILVLDIARSFAVRGGRSVDVMVTADSGPEVLSRVLSAESRVGAHNMRMGTLTSDDWARFERRLDDVRAAPLRITEVPPSTAAWAQPAPGADLLVLDSLASGSSLREELAAVRETALVRQCSVLVVLDEPAVADRRDVDEVLFRGTGLVLRVEREDLVDKDSPRAGEADLIVRRNRYGPVTTMTVAFQGHYSRFVDLAAG